MYFFLWLKKETATEAATTMPELPITCSDRDHVRCKEEVCKDENAYCFYGHFKLAKLVNPCSCELFDHKSWYYLLVVN